LDVVRIWLQESPGEYRLHAQAGLAEQPGDRRGRFEPGEGIVGWVMEHLTPLGIPDLPVDPRLKSRHCAKAEGLVSLAAVPLMRNEVPIGVIVGLSRQRREFAADEVALMQALATSAAVAIRNARLYEDTQRGLRYNETLVAVSQAIGSTLDLTDILRRATREMVRALAGDMGVAWLLAPDRPRFVPLVGSHIPKDGLGATAGLGLELDDPVITALRAARGAVAAVDSQAQAWSSGAASQIVAHKSMLIQPIFWKDELIGGFSIL